MFVLNLIFELCSMFVNYIMFQYLYAHKNYEKITKHVPLKIIYKYAYLLISRRYEQFKLLLLYIDTGLFRYKNLRKFTLLYFQNLFYVDFTKEKSNKTVVLITVLHYNVGYYYGYYFSCSFSTSTIYG